MMIMIMIMIIISYKTPRLVLSSLSYLPNTRHRLLAQDFFGYYIGACCISIIHVAFQ